MHIKVNNIPAILPEVNELKNLVCVSRDSLYFSNVEKAKKYEEKNIVFPVDSLIIYEEHPLNKPLIPYFVINI